MLRMPNTRNAKVALFWTPDGKRKRGKPKKIWRRTVERVASSWRLRPRTGRVEVNG